MEGNDGGLSSYYQHHQHHHHHHQSSTSNSATNGSIFSNPNSHYSASEPTPLVFPHSVTPRASAAPSPALTDSVKRKRGRPRKYGPGGPATEMSSPASTAMKKAPATTTAAPSSLPISSSSAISPSTPTPHKKEPSSSLSSSSNRKAQLDALGSAGHGFTPHVITVAAGEDVAQKIMSFMQQRKRAVCILSASGSISNASLRQPAMLGGNVTYEGRFEILSLSGSYLHTEIGGASSRTGGLSVCLSGADGRIVGGGVGGPLKAAGPVQRFGLVFSRTASPSNSRRVKRTISNVKTLWEDDVHPHYVMRRYAKFTASLIQLNVEYGDGQLELNLDRLRMAVDELLIKLAKTFTKPKPQTAFLINNYDMTIAVLKWVQKLGRRRCILKIC